MGQQPKATAPCHSLESEPDTDNLDHYSLKSQRDERDTPKLLAKLPISITPVRCVLFGLFQVRLQFPTALKEIVNLLDANRSLLYAGALFFLLHGLFPCLSLYTRPPTCSRWQVDVSPVTASQTGLLSFPELFAKVGGITR